ncbi:Serine/threonine protein kinase [Chondrus crispus]|uniref:Serine/threonine protein kinase n=1 Tax=Chondrus crispus TaxID=2769 RepID=R7QF36_CHOCR|nr:Serine/threonine protein kinase [Chondrus crispus]CDF36388.1 Serine/threonine protein kinase [Chondrus crispus]|eukprot:XP_005716207.1 Serine/threonine protein kinase [Chondrus crispus]
MTFLSCSQTYVQGVRGKCVGPYELLDTLGSGNFGKVKRARHIYLDTFFAIKIVEKSVLVDNISGNMDIRREMSILRALDHPHIVSLQEVMHSRHRVYLVMDLASRGDFYDLLKKHGPFAENQARIYFAQLVDAVAYCHERGVFHRDLKPENLLLDAQGDLKVTDFGFGAMQDRAGTVLRTSCGSPHYCAPEVWGGQDGYDGRKADAFSAGVILYTLVAGGQPFNDEKDWKVLKKVAKCQPSYPDKMSVELVDLLEKLIVKKPAERWDLQMVKNHPWLARTSLYERQSVLMKKEMGFVLVGGCNQEGRTQGVFSRMFGKSDAEEGWEGGEVGSCHSWAVHSDPLLIL